MAFRTKAAPWMSPGRAIPITSIMLALTLTAASGPASPATKAEDEEIVAGSSAPSGLPAKKQTLVHDGLFFDVTKPGDPDPVLIVPAGVVLTDAHVSFSVPESVPNAAALIIRTATKFLVYHIVNDTTYHAGIDLGSGIPSTGDLTVTLSCYNIDGNHCQGAMMWSGYEP